MDTGITFKVLKADTPMDVAIVISAARNKVTAAALTEHEWSTISSLCQVGLVADANLAVDLVYQQYLQRVRGILGEDVVDNIMTNQLIHFVHSMREVRPVIS